MANCRTCGARILWFRMEGSGKPMPVDADALRVIVPTAIDGEGRVVVAYRSHFATCPDADQHRKKGGV